MRKAVYTNLEYEDNLPTERGSGSVAFAVSRAVRQGSNQLHCCFKMFVSGHVLVNPTLTRAGLLRLREMIDAVLLDWDPRECE